MDVTDVLIKCILWISGIMMFGLVCGLMWTAWVYVNDLESHSEMTEKEEREMLSDPRFYQDPKSEVGGG